MDANIKPVLIEAGFCAEIMRRNRQLDSLPRLGGIGGRGNGQIAVRRAEPLNPRDPSAGERVIQDPRIVGLKIERLGRLHLEPELVLRDVLENFPRRLVLHHKRTIVKNDGMLGPHGARRIRVGLPITRPFVRREVRNNGHIRGRRRGRAEPAGRRRGRAVCASFSGSSIRRSLRAPNGSCKDVERMNPKSRSALQFRH